MVTRLDIQHWQQLDQPWWQGAHAGEPSSSLHIHHHSYSIHRPIVQALAWWRTKAGCYLLESFCPPSSSVSPLQWMPLDGTAIRHNAHSCRSIHYGSCLDFLTANFPVLPSLGLINQQAICHAQESVQILPWSRLSPCKVDDQCTAWNNPLGGYSLTTVFQGHPWVGLQCGDSPCSAPINMSRWPSHGPGIGFLLLWILITDTPHKVIGRAEREAGVQQR